MLANGMRGPALFCRICKRGKWMVPVDKLEKVKPGIVTEGKESMSNVSAIE